MLTVQTNIALQIIGTLTQEELVVFAKEFEKLQKPVAICKPKKIKIKTIYPTFDDCMKYVRELHGIQAQGKLA